MLNHLFSPILSVAKNLLKHQLNDISLRQPSHWQTSKIGLICLLLPLPLLGLFEQTCLRRLILTFSRLTNSLNNGPSLIWDVIDGDARERLACRGTGYLQSCSALPKVQGKSSSSEMTKELNRAFSSSIFEFEKREDHRGHEGNTQQSDCCVKLDEDSISIRDVMTVRT